MVTKTTYIQTLDGEAKVEWWEMEDFRGRTSQIYRLDKDLSSGTLTHEIPIPDDSIVCDFCNVKIEEFPVPVVWGTHALCKKCFEDTKK